MHRTLDIAVSSDVADGFVSDLTAIPGVVSLSHHRGASVMPPGDRVTVHVLNRSMDDVLRSPVANKPYGQTRWCGSLA